MSQDKAGYYPMPECKCRECGTTKAFTYYGNSNDCTCERCFKNGIEQRKTLNAKSA